MSISKPIIDSGPTQPRAEAKIVVGRISPVAPPASYLMMIDDEVATISNLPEREGQFVFVQKNGALSVSMYIVIQGPVELEWKRVYSSGVIQDPRTGKPKDPLYGLF